MQDGVKPPVFFKRQSSAVFLALNLTHRMTGVEMTPPEMTPPEMAPHKGQENKSHFSEVIHSHRINKGEYRQRGRRAAESHGGKAQDDGCFRTEPPPHSGNELSRTIKSGLKRTMIDDRLIAWTAKAGASSIVASTLPSVRADGTRSIGCHRRYQTTPTTERR